MIRVVLTPPTQRPPLVPNDTVVVLILTHSKADLVFLCNSSTEAKARYEWKGKMSRDSLHLWTHGALSIGMFLVATAAEECFLVMKLLTLTG